VRILTYSRLFRALVRPSRPATSFFWLTSPWKSLKYIIWKNYKWWILLIFVILVVGAFIVLLICEDRSIS